MINLTISNCEEEIVLPLELLELITLYIWDHRDIQNMLIAFPNLSGIDSIRRHFAGIKRFTWCTHCTKCKNRPRHISHIHLMRLAHTSDIYPQSNGHWTCDMPNNSHNVDCMHPSYVFHCSQCLFDTCIPCMSKPCLNCTPRRTYYTRIERNEKNGISTVFFDRLTLGIYVM